VEFFLNFAWLVLSASLAIHWIRASRSTPARSRQLDRKLQLLALAILIVILLPVISMTDDVQAMSTAEIEHVTRRADLLPNSDQPADIVIPQETNFFSSRFFFCLQSFARVEPSAEDARPQCGSIRLMATRPPPLAA
jgi:hypothetical protein